MNATPTNAAATPNACASGSHPLRTDHDHRWTQTPSVGAEPLDPGHKCNEFQGTAAGVDPLATDHPASDLHICDVGGGSSPASPTSGFSDPTNPASGWLELRIWAEMFNDAQLQRIASNNRAERGGVDSGVYIAYTEALQRAEDICRLHMKRCYRRVVPAEIVDWQKATVGLGDSNLARLLGHLGHPVWATPHHWEGTGAARHLVADDPYRRTVGQLWQYCGHGDPARSRPRKGMTAEQLAAIGSPTLKMIVHLNAEGCMKQMASPFRLVYEKARIDCEDSVHAVECVRCGPSGKPAQPGSAWAKGHQHGHALRIVGKEILRDLWIVAGGGATDSATPSREAPHSGGES